MRLDKYLKVSRLIKRRTLAKEVSDQGRITINGNVAKAGSDVKVEDVLTIRFGQKLVTVKVTALNMHLKITRRACMKSLKSVDLKKRKLEVTSNEK